VFSVSAGGGLVLYTYFKRRELAFWEKLALYVCAMNLLPLVSGDYKLLHLLLPLVFFVNAPGTGRYGVFCAVLFGLLLAPKSFFICLSVAHEAVFLNPLLMLALSFTIIFRVAFQSRYSVLRTSSQQSSAKTA
jgi:hypothetical protein